MRALDLVTRYFGGWGVIVRSLLTAAIWELVVFVPFILFFIVLPDHMEGHADGAAYVRVACLVTLLIWAPIAALKVGGLAIEETDGQATPEPPTRILDPRTGIESEIDDPPTADDRPDREAGDGNDAELPRIQ